jgi:hypothetical protein
MDLALAIDNLIPAAEYYGSTNENTKEAYEVLRWEDNRAKPTWNDIVSSWAEVEPKLTAKANLKAQIEAGFPVEGKGFNLAVDDISQSKFTSYLILLEKKQTANDSQVPIKDKDGTVHFVTFAELQEILKSYGEFCTLLSMGG